MKSPRASAQGEFHAAAEEEPAEGSEGHPHPGAAPPWGGRAALAALTFRLQWLCWEYARGGRSQCSVKVWPSALWLQPRADPPVSSSVAARELLPQLSSQVKTLTRALQEPSEPCAEALDK